MAKKLWCTSPSDPVVNQVAKKYNLSQKDAKTIINTAKRDNPALQGDAFTLDFLESQDSFKNALNTYIQDYIDTENDFPLLVDVAGQSRNARDLQQKLRDEYGMEMDEDEVQDIIDRIDDFPKSVRISKDNMHAITAVLKSFKDSRRMEFLGNWICRALSDFITQVQFNPELRKKYKIKKYENRIDYFVDIDAQNAFRAEILGDPSLSEDEGTLESRANDLEEEGKTELANELNAVREHFNTLLFMYGGNIFRDEGISVSMSGNLEKTGYSSSSAERNNIDTESEEDENDNDGETVVTTFSASDQNKSILTKMVPDIKVMLNMLHDMTGRGSEKADQYGYGLWTYVPASTAVNKLLRLCKGCETYSDMMKVLLANQKATPWLSQLIGALDTSNAYDISGVNKVSQSKKEQLQSMFFQSFRKQFMRFRHKYQSIDENGDIIFVDSESNQKSKSVQILKSVQSKLRRMTGMPIIKYGMISPEELDKISVEVGEGERSQKNLGTIGKELAVAVNEARKIAQQSAKQGEKLNYKTAYEKLDAVAEHIKDVLEKFGIKVSDQMLTDYSVNDPLRRSTAGVFGNSQYADQEFATRYIRLQSLAKQLKNLNEKTKAWVHGGIDAPSLSPFSKKVRDTDNANPIRGAYRTIINNLTEFSPDAFESRAHVNGKDYYSWNNPSSIQTVVEHLQNSDLEKVREYIMNKYGQDTLWYMIPKSEGQIWQDKAELHSTGRTEQTEDSPVFYSDLIEALYYGRERGLDYSEVLAFAGDGYNDMSDASYALAMLNDFFTIQDYGLSTARGHAWYRMFIAGDKPRFATVRLPRYSDTSTESTEFGEVWSEKNFHNVIARKAVDFLAQEIRRSEEVIRHASKHSSDLTIKGYDIDTSKKQFKPVFDKIKRGEKITVDDVVTDGRYIFQGTGASFYLNKFINDEIANKTALGKYVVDRIFNSHLQTEPRPAVDMEIIGTFKRAFHEYMSQMRDDMIGKLDDSGVFEEKIRQNEEGKQESHLKYLIGNMRQWNIDVQHYGKMVYSNSARAKELAERYGIDLDADKNRRYRTYFNEMAQFEKELEEFVYNNWLAKANMSELFDVDLAFYGDTPYFQKRNSQVVSSGHTTDPDARIHGEKVSDGYYRTITIKTKKEKSSHIDQVEQLLRRRLKQITDPLRAKQFEIGMNDTLEKLKKQDTTDGQAFVGLTALRKRLAGQGEWSRSDDMETDRLGYIKDDKGNITYVYTDEAVYWRMKNNYKGVPEEVKTNDMQHVFAQIQKDFVYTTDHIKREGRGKISVPVQHKNSEYMLSFLTSFVAIENPGSQIEAIARFLEETAEDDITKGIDTVNFDSAVKIGGTSGAIDLSGKNGKETLKALRDAVYKKEKGGKKTYKPGVVTVYDNKDYKIVQEKPEHYKKTQQPTGSQFKILTINNIPDTTAITLPNGKTITGKDLKKRYFSLLRQKTKNAEYELRKELGLRRPASQRLHKLSNFLKSAMSTDQKFSVEMRRNLTVIERNGIDRFVTPLDEPEVQAAVEAMLLSKARRTYYKQKTNGGIVVQATSWGSAEDLHIRFFSSDENDIKNHGGILRTLEEYKAEHPELGDNAEESYNSYKKTHQQGYAYFEIEAPMPDYVRAMIANKDGSIDSKYLDEDGNWNMEEIKKVVPDSVFDAICYRVPTEAKYSIMACRVIKFSREGGGSVAKYPKELTTFTGSDFDIDTDTVELRPMPSQKKNKDIDNELFDLALAALRSDPSIGETFKPGDFSDVSEDSYYLTLAESGLYTKDQLDAMTPDQLKDECKFLEDLDVMNPITDIILHNQNSDSKSMIGIAAVGVTSHAFLSLYNDVDETDDNRNPSVHPENFVRMSFKESGGKKSGESFTVIDNRHPDRVTKRYIGGDVLLDMMYDMDGKLISTEISKYVGASADAAKDAALYRLGLNQRTLPIAILMHRLGISSDMIRAFMKQPVIKNVIRTLSKPNETGQISIEDACRTERREIANALGMNDKEFRAVVNDINTDPNLTLSYNDLVDTVIKGEHPVAEDALKILHIFEVLADKAEKLRALDGFTRYNSANAMKGSSFFDRLVSRNRLKKLANSLEGDNPTFKLPNDIEMLEEFSEDEFGKLCSMFPHIGQTIVGEEELLEEIILDNMKTYSPAFFALTERLGITENADAMRDLYEGWKNYLLFVSDKRIADFRYDKNAVLFYTRDFARYYAETLDQLLDNPNLKDVLDGNSFIDSIGFVEAKEGYGDFDVLSSDTINLTGPALEKFKRDWETLVKTPETREFAVNIAIHFLARSAAFARDTPVHLMPYAVKKAIPGYLDVFFDADKIHFDENELDSFLVSFCRNNVSNRRFVPHLKTKDDAKSPRIWNDGEGNMYIKAGVGSSLALKNNIEETKDGDETIRTLRSPVMQLENLNGTKQLYLAVDNDVEVLKSGKDNYYLIQVVPVTPLGIPNQILEYTGDNISETSIFLDEGQDAPDQDDTTEDIQIEPEIVSEDADMLVDEMDDLNKGQVVGTYLESEVFGDGDIDEDVEAMLAREPIDYKNNPYLESRTHLKRVGKLARALGLNLRYTQRGYNPLGKPSYLVSIAETTAENPHDNAVRLAALVSGLGFERKDETMVKTYVRDIMDANSVQFSIKVNMSDSSIKDLLARLDTDAEYNADTKELTFYNFFTSTTPGERIQQIRDFITDIKHTASLYDIDGQFEVNYTVRDALNKNDQIEILTEIKNEARNEESRRDAERANQESSETRRNDSRRKVRLSDLAELAIRRLNGEDVKDEIRRIFNESYSPLVSPETSYVSRRLSDTVQSRLADVETLRSLETEDMNDTLNRVISGKTRVETDRSRVIDNLIINTANWIIGNRSTDTLESMVEDIGFEHEEAANIIATIKEVINEQDIC